MSLDAGLPKVSDWTPPWSRQDHPDVVGRRHVGRWLVAVVMIVLVAALGRTLVTNTNFQWGVVGRYFTASSILAGLARTLILTAAAMAIAITLGIILALMRRSGNPILRVCSGVYIWFFRGTPLLVQLIFWFNLAALYPRLSFGVPFGPAFVSGQTSSIISLYTAALLGLGLNEAAYMAEIVRGGLLAVPSGQFEAAAALGMPELTGLRRIVLPQVLRVIIPPTGNETIAMLKNTSLVSVISLPELLYSAQLIYARNFETIPLLIVASLWYLAVTTILSIGQHFIERKYGKGYDRTTRAPRGRRPRSEIRSSAGDASGRSEGAVVGSVHS
jgi:polar amino acid transport system permease protein